MGFTVALLLIATTATAPANRLAFSQDDFRFIFRALTFSADAGNPVICGVTLLGSFHSRTVTKTLSSLVGHISHAAIDGCQGDGDATVLQETLPWHLVYGGFYEDLPEIEGVNLRLVGASFRFEDGIACLFRTDTAEPAGGEATRISDGWLIWFFADEDFEIDLDDPSFPCALAGDARLSGLADVTLKDGEQLFLSLV